MNSLFTRLTAAFLAIIVLVILIVSFTLIVLLRSNPLVQRQDLARLSAASVNITRADLPAGALSPERLAARVRELAATYGVRLLITNGAGDVEVDSAAAGAAEFTLRRFRSARTDALFPDARVGLVRDLRGQQWLYVARGFGPDRILVVAGQPGRFTAAAFFGEYLLLPLAEAAGIAAVLAMILAVIIARSIANPLHGMAAAAQGIARGDPNTPAIPLAGPDEVRSLGEALNHMTGQLQSTQQAQRDFLANVSHELRTPLTSIQGFAQALLDGAAATPEAVQRSAGIIFGEADRMRRLVDGLLDLARLDSGLRALNLAQLDLRGLLAGAAEKFSLRAGTAGVTLVADLPASLPPITGDADRLAQVVANLLDNALKHTPAGGRVTLSAAASPTSIEISVSDTGPGIPPEDLGRIFERFYQVDKSRAHSAGLGLGLAISREIVEAHGGRLRVESVTGLGSRFTVRLPLPAGPESTARGKSKRGEPQ